MVNGEVPFEETQAPKNLPAG